MSTYLEFDCTGRLIEEKRACLETVESSPSRTDQLRPIVNFNPRSQYEFPCESILSKAGEGILSSLPMPRVPKQGCRNQRLEDLCPRGLRLMPEEI